MRLRINEVLEKYNSIRGKKMTLRELALLAYADSTTDDQTKVNRISALNTGKTMGRIDDVGAICDVLECNCDELIGSYE